MPNRQDYYHLRNQIGDYWVLGGKIEAHWVGQLDPHLHYKSPSWT